eukprot:s127_g9.t1
MSGHGVINVEIIDDDAATRSLVAKHVAKHLAIMTERAEPSRGLPAQLACPAPVDKSPELPKAKPELKRQNAQFFEFKVSPSLQQYMSYGHARPVEPETEVPRPALRALATPQRGDLQSLPSAGSKGTHEPVEAKQEYSFFDRDSLDLNAESRWNDDKEPEETQIDTPSPPQPCSQSGWDFRSPDSCKALLTPEPATESAEKIEASEAPSGPRLSMDGYCNPDPEIPTAPGHDDQAVDDHVLASETDSEAKGLEVPGVPVEPARKRRRKSGEPPAVEVPSEALDPEQAKSGKFVEKKPASKPAGEMASRSTSASSGKKKSKHDVRWNFALRKYN